MKITRLEVNHLTNPIGYYLDPLTLSYTVTEARGTKTASARVEIAKTPDFAALVYDSGVRDNIDSRAFAPELSLEPETRYFWRVSVTDDAGDCAVSETAFFETAPASLNAQWVKAPFEDPDTHPLLMRKFTLPKKPVCARLNVSGLGLYEAYLNGEKVSEEYLTPFYNDYNHWVQYQTFDVTEQLAEGENAVGFMLGEGWWMGRFGFVAGMRKVYGSQMQLIMRLHVTFEDGSETVLVSDENLLCHRSPILESSIYDGEVYDSRLEVPGFATPSCDLSGWVKAVLAEAPKGNLMPRLSPALTAHETFKPAELIHTPAGETVLDFGQEITGTIFFHCRAPKDTRIKLTFGEILQDDNFYTENLRTAKQEYTFIASGDDRLVRPYFTFYGYRFVKVEGLEEVCPNDFTAVVLHSDLRRTGWIETSNPKVNRLFLNALWGQKGNFVDVPTDCPQRDERMGWTGDAQAFCATAHFNMASSAFYRKYLYDMLTEQAGELNGSCPFVVPDVLNQIARVQGAPETSHASCAWGDAATVIPWTNYLFSGDKELLRAQYENMERWTDYIHTIDVETGDLRLWHTGFHFADWLALDNYHQGSSFGGTDPYFIASAYYLYSTELTAKAAEILGLSEDALYYRTLAKEIREAMQQEYFTPTGKLAVDTQTALVLALHFDIAPAAYRPRLIRDLKKKLDDEKIHLTTGFVGTAYLCRTLSENGLTDYAYTLLLNKDYPSWLYEVNMGATTIWERWNSVLPNGKISDTGMNSLNHYAYGAIVEWIYRHAAGLNPDETAPGFKHFTLAPEVDPRFDFVRMSYDSPYGEIKSHWEKKDDTWHFSVTVPFDTQATFIAPGGADGYVNGTLFHESIELIPGSYDIRLI